jgi:hypothetical protein
MRRAYLYSRLPICLFGLVVLGGCRQDGACTESAACTECRVAAVSPQTEIRAQFDMPAIVEELTGPTSTYCPVRNGPKIDRLPPIAELGLPVPVPDAGIPGICVIEMLPDEAAKPRGR